MVIVLHSTISLNRDRRGRLEGKIGEIITLASPEFQSFDRSERVHSHPVYMYMALHFEPFPVSLYVNGSRKISQKSRRPQRSNATWTQEVEARLNGEYTFTIFKQHALRKGSAKGQNLCLSR